MHNFVLINDDCLTALKELPDNSLDSLVTDPPAGIAFMGKEWDENKGGRTQWVAWMREVMMEVFRVLKPGAHGLVWALPRTSHWTATALEDAGFEIRDVITHLFGTGFPKSMGVSKAIDKAAGAEREVIGRTMGASNTRGFQDDQQDQSGGSYNQKGKYIDVTAPATEAAKQWQGWGTALKPASEHWILVRKPCSEKTVAANVLKWGTGAINIDACRVGTEVRHNGPASTKEVQTMGRPGQSGSGWNEGYAGNMATGRFPANLVLGEEAAEALDEQSGVLKSGGGIKTKAGKKSNPGGWEETRKEGPKTSPSEGGASRFFYVAKASKKDKGAENTHPTVKSTELMVYLCKLVTPPEGVILDPFTGSGSTGVAALRNGFRFLGVEKQLEYFKIAEVRLSEAENNSSKDTPAA